MKRLKVIQELVDKLEGDYTQVHKFKFDGTEYYSDTKLRKYLNNLFSADLKAVYVRKQMQDADTKFRLDWSAETIIMVNAKGRVIRMENSEWAFFEEL
jgi:hypothetical protein